MINIKSVKESAHSNITTVNQKAPTKNGSGGKGFGVVLTPVLEMLAILKGGEALSVSTL